ncbi:hypothetical protein [Lewinella cohaerens]|uniref:hypothetical protein n=1 Tax=Lewinella cohaerens TaxID=70995 RepID=UPI00036FD7CF|nr:hypothetical protein [Lewinella cohaerens]
MKFRLYYLLFLLLMGCSAKYHTVVDQVLPARVPAIAQMRSLTVVDRAREANLGTRLETGDLYSQGNVRFLERCARQLPVAANVYNKSQRDANAGSPAPRLNSSQVRDFGGQSEGLLCLEQLFPREVRTYETYDKHQLDEQGKDYYIRAVRATKSMTLSALWRLYEVRTGRVIVELPYLVEDIVEAEGLDQTSVNTKLDTLYTFNPSELQQQSMDMFLADVLPTPIESSWLYYSKGGSLMERSAELLEARRYHDAVRLFEANAKSIDRLKKPGRAILNWATALFLDGQSQEALAKAYEGQNRYGGSDFTAFIKKVRSYE